MPLFRDCLVLAALVASSAAAAADLEAGRRIAELRCVPCHAVGAGAGKDVTAAPPFEALARKFTSSPDTLAFSLRNPHPKMNVTLSRREMEDVAGYINSLAKQ